MEPYIEEGYRLITWYSYGAELTELLAAALKWISSHPEYRIEDIITGQDEGTWVKIYCAWEKVLVLEARERFNETA